ncbi:MAG TPA: hypothetical protein VMY59_07105 [Candidatus Thermoplasmatota archaeon]|nr:hypothetical protein [Candidatus Thermoplasmatota archaeon]
MLWLSVLTPMVLADETSISVTFDPDGVIDIDVTPKTYDFGSIQPGAWSNTTANYFTIYNNGTLSMDTQFKTNATTDSTNLTLDADGSPGLDSYSFQTNGLDTDGYITAAYAVEQDTGITAGTNKVCGLCLNMGSSISQNWTSQRTTIYLQGSVS